MKKMTLSKALITTSMVVTLLFTASTAFAMAGVPAQPSGSAPYGLALQGAAKGTKLTGTIVIKFDPLKCSDLNTAAGIESCTTYGADLGFAHATLRLRKAAGTLENSNLTDSGKTDIQVFESDLGYVPINNPGAIQAKALDIFTPKILEGFGFASDLKIYTKSVGEFSTSFLNNSAALFGTYFYDTSYNKIVSFTSVADVVLAVNSGM